ncbi:hypothetical protein QE441_001499 [Chryseobacterium sp. SORGH_AS909]|uniref:Uncharacterized protein n=1 Tax=Chryseobacterium camelliae TaxID=1265445 RepID=A0ABU0TMS5_9FLAO|nr:MULTISPECIES: hypothetical protein [unclassified Chryseobacterium]MDQ1098342.1 hypothetical protein [Chryseobacterium camelliae]MDR6085705.1 hypothetical protein [Chryseobacterium sp. SORGH_AS_0909]MDR6130071.1 hypothetical protein [Chryseobacterium sp. SORGH_AS_1175]MDT3407803.1 hypothetical protein [Pseudacidovorax intermedius]
MEKVIVICGIYSFLFGIFHLFFWRFFKWKKELAKLSLVNKGVVQILNIQLIFFFFSMAFICFFFTKELVETSLGKTFLVVNSGFWAIRIINQFIFLKINDYRVHLLTFIFFIGFILFLIPVVY